MGWVVQMELGQDERGTLVSTFKKKKKKLKKGDLQASPLLH